MEITDSKYYLIDLDGVILDTDYDNYFWQRYIPIIYAKKRSISEEDARNITHTLFNYKKKSKDWYDVVYWSNILDIDIIQEKKKPANMSLIKLKEGSMETLDILKSLGKKLYLVTNAHRKTLDIKLSKYDISKYFEDLICSHELGYIKENIQFWHLLKNKLGIEFSDTVLIEDTLDNIDSAYHAGIKNLIWINNNQDEFERLRLLRLDAFSDLASTIQN
tara:strand:- start:3619 stop:4275 length:657 start_codon:yes stop_codon:yes gene_type:complete